MSHDRLPPLWAFSKAGVLYTALDAAMRARREAIERSSGNAVHEETPDPIPMAETAPLHPGLPARRLTARFAVVATIAIVMSGIFIFRCVV